MKDHWPRYETASSGMEVVVGASDGDADEVRDGLRREHVNNRAMRLWQRQERVYAPDSTIASIAYLEEIHETQANRGSQPVYALFDMRGCIEMNARNHRQVGSEATLETISIADDSCAEGDSLVP